MSFVEKYIKGDKVVWAVVLLLAIFSVLAVYSSIVTLAYKYKDGDTLYYLIKHSFILFIGFWLMLLAHQLNYKYYSRISQIALFISIPLLLLTLWTGANINDASRWLVIPVIDQTFQTSDLAKLALIMYLARLLYKKQDNIKDFKSAFVPIMLPVLIVCGLILPANFSTALMLFTTSLIIMFIGRVSLKYIFYLIAIAVGSLLLMLLIAKANPDKDGYFSVPGFMEKQQVGRSKIHRKLKLEYARQAIDRWADSLNAPDFDYLSTDHLRTMPGHDPDGKRAEPQERALAFINQARSDEFRDNLYRKLIPRITAKEYAYDLEDTLSDLKSCVTGAGKKDGFTKPVAKKILEVLDSKRIRNSEDLDYRIQAAKEELGRMDDFKELDVYFTRKNAPLAQEQYPAVTINTSEGRKEISINTRPATLLDWAEQCIKAEYALEQHNRFYFGKQGSGKHGAGRTVEERIDKFNKTAINPAESTQAVEFNYENLRRRFPTSSAYDKAIGQKHTYKARSTIKKEKERIFIEISKELRPEDRSQLKKTPSERIDTAITQFYQQDADDSLKQKVEDYVALTKLLDYVDNAGTNGMYDRMRCSLQDTFSRAKARISGKVDACPEVYRE